MYYFNFFIILQIFMKVTSKKIHLTIIFVLLASMSIKGYQNLQRSYSRLGKLYTGRGTGTAPPLLQ